MVIEHSRKGSALHCLSCTVLALSNSKISKRKHSAYTLEFKLKIISEVDEKNLLKTEICKKIYSIPNSTLSTILKDREKLQKAREDSKFHQTTKKMKLCSHEELEGAVFLWFRQARAMNVPFSGPIIIGKATEEAVTSPEKWPKTKLALNQNAFKLK